MAGTAYMGLDGRVEQRVGSGHLQFEISFRGISKD